MLHVSNACRGRPEPDAPRIVVPRACRSAPESPRLGPGARCTPEAGPAGGREVYADVFAFRERDRPSKHAQERDECPRATFPTPWKLRPARRTCRFAGREAA